MNRSGLILLLIFSLLPPLTQARSVTDMVGRQVVLPDGVASVYGSAPPLTVLIYALAPETLAAVNYPFTDIDAAYLTPRTSRLPVLGNVVGMGRAMNPEGVMALKPDLALGWDSVYADRARTEEAFAKSGQPMVFVTLNTLADWPPALRFLGKLMRREKRAEILATYIESRMAAIEAGVASIPAAQRIKVYYAESADGLASECDSSFHAEAIRLAGGQSVLHCTSQGHMGLEKVSLEQVLAWNPQIIIAQEKAFFSSVRNDPRWQSIRAVQDGRVYYVPHAPFNWLDRPPSLMRALGVQWLAGLFYPQRFPADIGRQTREFYQLFLGVTLNEQSLQALFRPSHLPEPPTAGARHGRRD